jgi:hypothetical protein
MDEKMHLFKRLWERWKTFGHKLGNFQARLILTFFYFVVICPFAAVVKFGAKPLRLKVFGRSNWLPDQGRDEDIMARARRQF